MILDNKIKRAFKKIRHDMDKLDLKLSTFENKLSKYSKTVSLSDEVKEKIDKLNELDLNSFTKNIETEVKSMNSFIAEMKVKSGSINSSIETISNKLESIDSSFEELKKRFESNKSDNKNTELDMKALSDQTAEFEMLIDEKVSLEMSSMKLENETGLANLAADLSKLVKKVDDLKEASKRNSNELAIEELSEMINEKVELELANFKMEILEELGDIKVSPKKKPKKAPPKKKEVVENEEKEGKLKKAVKWLFVDEEDDDLSDVKSQIEKK